MHCGFLNKGKKSEWPHFRALLSYRKLKVRYLPYRLCIVVQRAPSRAPRVGQMVGFALYII